MKILLTEDGKKFFVKDPSKDFHSTFGFITSSDFKKKDGTIVQTNMGKKMTLASPTFMDRFEKIKRGPQIIPLKDVGLIIAETGLHKKSKVVDAGTGSGALCFQLATIAKEVTSYEIREDFHGIAQENKKFLDLKNVKLKLADVQKGIQEKKVDLATFDLPDPWNALPSAIRCLKVGGFLVSYSPTIPQVMDMVNALHQSKQFVILKTCEVMEREWEVEERKVRPKSQQIGHSGFLTFARKR